MLYAKNMQQVSCGHENIMWRLLLLVLATSAWDLYKLWGGGIPTLEIEHFVPRLCRLEFHFNLSLLPEFNFILPFLDRSFPPLSYCLLIRSRPSSKPSRFTCYPPTLTVQSAIHLGLTHTLHLPSSAACPRAPCHVPEPDAVTCAGMLPPFLPYAFTEVPGSPWGVCPSQVPMW